MVGVGLTIVDSGKRDPLRSLAWSWRRLQCVLEGRAVSGTAVHRDISKNNIIITDPKTADGFTGMLIDLDLAIVGGERSGARHQTGTMEFMAIDVLRGVKHTYRHDLESFFYVLCGYALVVRGKRSLTAA